MRPWRTLALFLSLLGTCACAAPHALARTTATPAAKADTRPLGKYLVGVCTLDASVTTPGKAKSGPIASSPSRVARPVTCTSANASQMSRVLLPERQTVTLKLACDTALAAPCTPAVPRLGDFFYVTGTSSAGYTVKQAVVLGHLTPSQTSKPDTVRYHVDADGPILLRGWADAGTGMAAAAPVDLSLNLTSGSGGSSCAVLPAPAPGTSGRLLNAKDIVTLLATPNPFTLADSGADAIAIYTSRGGKLSDGEQTTLRRLENNIRKLARTPPGALGVSTATSAPFSVTLRIPHANAMGDLATRLNALNFSQFTVKDSGRGYVQISASSQPDCDTWKQFLTAIRTAVWQVVSYPMNHRLFYLNAPDVVAGFTALNSASGSGSGAASGNTATGSSTAAGSAGATASTGSGSTSGNTPSGSSGSTSAGSTTAAGTGGATASTGSGSTSGNTTISVSQPAGSTVQITSDSTACIAAATAGSATCGSSSPASTSAAATSSTTSAAAAQPAVTPMGMAALPVTANTGESAVADMLLYSDSNAGDDAQIEERNRILAQIDLPRPEVILNAWVAQDSSASQESIGAFTTLIADTVSNYNQRFEDVVWKGWRSLQSQSVSPSFFYEPFRSYIADHFIADTSQSAQPDGASAEALSQAFLDHSQASLNLSATDRQAAHLCPANHYCLGYGELFNPAKPILTDLLLMIVAAQNPMAAAQTTIRDIEGTSTPTPRRGEPCSTRHGDQNRYCEGLWKRLREILPLELGPQDLAPPAASPATTTSNCADADLRGIMGALLQTGVPTVHLQCFLQEAERVLGPDVPGGVRGVGLMRATIADFLFHYKMSQQYPHEFSAYNLSHTANALNGALGPLVDAFNRDLRTYQTFVQADVSYRVEELNRQTDGRCCAKRLFGLDKPYFLNNGLVTVRTISGQKGDVETTSQSSLNVSQAPQLGDVLSALSGVGATDTSSKILAGPLASLGNPAALLAKYQTTQAQIGRSLNFTVTPRSLATASSAELDVVLKGDEAGAPTYKTAGAPDSSRDLSRIATYETTTRVRVESIKLFEISSFSATVETSRSRFPLLPPFVQIPYIGTFAGVPLGPAREFHATSAIISAYVIPTAADLAFGLRFSSDLVTDATSPGPCTLAGSTKADSKPGATHPCVFNRMLSLRDLGDISLAQYNNAMAACFTRDSSATGCLATTFENTPDFH